MDPVQRRRSPRSLARLAAILIANAAALAGLWWLIAPAREELHAADKAPVEVAEPAAALAAAAPSPASVPIAEVAELATHSALAKR
jgi:hypothetical protein